MHLHQATGRICFPCLVLKFIFASCNKHPFHFNIIKFELPGFQSGRVPFLFVPYFVLRICTGTETSVGGCTSQKCDIKLTRPARKRGGREGPPQARPNPWVGRPLVKPTRLPQLQIVGLNSLKPPYIRLNSINFFAEKKITNSVCFKKNKTLHAFYS